jgi:hypothetical protein
MGTNYYWIKNPCPHCGHGDRLHIGKSAAGWKFMFHAPEGVRSYTDWLEILRSDRGTIVSQYGEEFSVGHFEEIVEIKNDDSNENPSVRDSNEWYDEDGYHFSGYEFS